MLLLDHVNEADCIYSLSIPRATINGDAELEELIEDPSVLTLITVSNRFTNPH